MESGMGSDGTEREEEALALLALTLEPVEPPAQLRARVLERVSGRGRYLAFAPSLARELDLPLPRMRELLEAATTEHPWQGGLLPGFAIIHFEAGPGAGERHAGFARMPAGFELPLHRHLVEELTMVLEGILVDDTGRLLGPGELVRAAPGSVHAITVVQDAVTVSLVGAVEAVTPEPQG
jgi:hypothetical protein